ncbi:nadp-specific glutamate dehydrogenase 1-related [Anaeramoeba flamelloides]|uniref:Glutamate dehydrogenase n=1 Tax=Anaeramoeba flamelloides TaxID=1746091 RepID=A0AAV8A7B7_9EUKA|nr:nadp-specific glutamate dehydrogenase 1-related [Anaeramoeba flamelloides]
MNKKKLFFGLGALAAAGIGAFTYFKLKDTKETESPKKSTEKSTKKKTTKKQCKKCECNAECRLNNIIKKMKERDPNQNEFHQAVEEVSKTLLPLFEKEDKYLSIFERMLEPERALQFRVAWMDEAGKKHVNRGFRVQFNSAIGPYKGGLRFHPSVNLSIIKFLGFEQILKNSLTTLPMGGGKGGSDFDPKGKSNIEIMNFCRAFMSELYRHIGPNCDVPAGDIGVGGREIGYLYGMYKKITAQNEGVLTGKGRNWGGSLIRPEATGYGLVYYLDNMLQANNKTLKGKKVLVSGSGNVAQYCVEKLLDLGAIPLTMSDSNGYIFVEGGITRKLLQDVMTLKNVKRGRLSSLSKVSGIKYHDGKRPWGEECDIALPCATQNEINKEDALALVKNGCFAVAEGANMPSDPDAQEIYMSSQILYGPAKAANAGGVAVSGLEMSQNSLRMNWTREEVDEKLQNIMKNIFNSTQKAASLYGKNDIDYLAGANIAGFIKVADSMINQGIL